MVCTYCRAETYIVNSRHQRRSNSTWRRRKCHSCARVVTTIEQIDYEKSWRVSYAKGPARPFLRDKLLVSVHKSLGHRPSALQDALGLTHTIVGKLGRMSSDGLLPAAEITQLTHLTLQRFDKTAATVYAAYHPGSLG